MFEIIALVCFLGQDVSECNKQSAQEVMSLGPVESDNNCLIQAQMRAGRNSRLNNLIENNLWVKFQCDRIKND
jgi:hypothetical protein